MTIFCLVTSDTALLQRVSCVVMVISSHGSEDEVAKGEISRPELRRQEVKYYQHRIATTDGSIRSSEIISMFDEMNCRALKGKPKIFFIQVNLLFFFFFVKIASFPKSMWILFGWIEVKLSKSMKSGCALCMEVRSSRGNFFWFSQGSSSIINISYKMRNRFKNKTQHCYYLKENHAIK